MKNQWIADRSYGTGMALAFSGEPDFVRRSIAFAVNFLISDKAGIKQQTPTFASVNTTKDNLQKGLELEGYILRMQELHQKATHPMDIVRDEDFPEDFEERAAKFNRAILFAETAAEVAEIEKSCPFIGLLAPDTPEQIEDATAYGKSYAARVLATIVSEDFMHRRSKQENVEHSVKTA